jgi:hypothetical protein
VDHLSSEDPNNNKCYYNIRKTEKIKNNHFIKYLESRNKSGGMPGAEEELLREEKVHPGVAKQVQVAEQSKCLRKSSSTKESTFPFDFFDFSLN